MNQSTRQRVVGTIVLLLAAIVVLPAVLDGSGVPARNVEDRIPARPVTDSRPLEVNPQRPAITADSDALRLAEEPADSAGASDNDAGGDDAAGSSDDEPPVADDGQAEVADSAADTPASGSTSAASAAGDRRPSLDPATGLPEAWSVQLGAFSNPANVEALVERLQAAGHPAYTRAIDSSSGSLTGVFVGPLVDRDTAVGLQGDLQTSFGLAGRVVRYRIEEE